VPRGGATAGGRDGVLFAGAAGGKGACRNGAFWRYRGESHLSESRETRLTKVELKLLGQGDLQV